MNEIWLGDCIELMKDIPDNSVDMILCDLPYGITSNEWDKPIPFAPLWKQYRRIVKNNSAIVLTASQPFTSALVMSNLKMFRYEWIWEKNMGSNFATTKYQPMKEHENILVFSKTTPTYYPIMEERSLAGTKRRTHIVNASNTGKRKGLNSMKDIDRGFISETRVPRSIQRFNRETGLHPNQKPVELFKYLIRTYTKENDLVLDNCAGSGTTGVACLVLNRKCILIEKKKEYFEGINQRINDLKSGLLF